MAYSDQYDKTYFEDGAAEKDTRVLEAILEVAQPFLPKDARVLDVGCASGRLMEVLRDRGYTRLTGIDISSHAVQETAKKGFEDVHEANLQDGVSLPEGAYDAVFMLDVIEHFTRPYDALLEVRRLLAPGGVLVVTTPNSNSVLRFVLGKRWALADESHVFYFTPFSLRYLLGKVGLRVRRVHTRSYNYGPVARALMALRSGGQIVAIAQEPQQGGRA